MISTKILEKPLTLYNENNDVIIGKLLQHNNTKPLIIICHGYDSSMEHAAIKQASIRLHALGYNIFTFNFSGKTQKFSLEQQVTDIQTITTYFSEYKDRILLAASFGALSSAIASLSNKEITGLITVNGFFGTAQVGIAVLRVYLLFHFFALFIPQYNKILHYLRKSFRPERIKIPVLVVHSPVDKDVSYKQSQYFYTKLPGPKTYYLLKNADHNFTTRQSIDEVVQVVDKWIRKTY